MKKSILSSIVLASACLHSPAALAQAHPAVITPPTASQGVQAPQYNKRSQLYRLRQECQTQAQQQGMSPEQTTAFVQNCLQGKH